MKANNEIKKVIEESYKGIVEKEVKNWGKETKVTISMLLNIIDKIQKNREIDRFQGEYGYYYRLKNRKGKVDKFLIEAAQFIYLFRSYLASNQLQFLIGVSDNEGHEYSKKFTEDEVLKNLKAYKSKGKYYVGISSTQLTLLKQQEASQRKLKNKEYLWERVKELAEINEVDWRRKKQINNQTIVGNKKTDINIYIKAKDVKKKIIANNTNQKYYQISSGQFEQFNTGWLYEWYHSIYYGSTIENYEKIAESIKQGSIEEIIQQRDFIRGTKQGDFLSAQGQWIQSKYENQKIISENNILNIFYEMKRILQNIQLNITGADDEFIDFIKFHFAPEASMTGEKIITNQINKITKKAKQILGTKTLTF